MSQRVVGEGSVDEMGSEGFQVEDDTDSKVGGGGGGGGGSSRSSKWFKVGRKRTRRRRSSIVRRKVSPCDEGCGWTEGWMNVFGLDWKKWNGWKREKVVSLVVWAKKMVVDGGYRQARSGDDIIGQCNDPKATVKDG